jgi:carbamoyltransferase
MAILGVSDSHNASAALIAEVGIRALQEERPTRIKNYFDLPTASIKWVLSQGGLEPGDVEELALANLVPFPPQDRQAMIRSFREGGRLSGRVKAVLRHSIAKNFVFSNRNAQRLSRYHAMGFRPDQIRTYEHHACHAATAYYGYGRLDEPVLVVTCDGTGDGLCATVGVGSGGAIERKFKVDRDDSFGTLFAVITYMTGMVPNEHEYKIMGMAPYASPSASRRMCDKLLGLYEWDAGGAPVWRRRPGVPAAFNLQPTLEKLFFEERFDAIMGGAQLFVETMLVEFVRRAIAVTGLRKVACSGGVFMNVKANKAIMEMSSVDDLYVFPSCGDETNAIGAAFLAQTARHGAASLPRFDSLYLGPELSEAGIEAALAGAVADGSMIVERPASINDAVVECLIAGEVVARVAGREEFGARSLGNRAILADPRSREVVQTINDMVKSRDFWMPFASSILAESADDYLMNPKNIPAPYMILSFDTTGIGSRDLLAGTHPYDRTCRPQIVSRESNPDYWDLIERFRKVTGVGGLLNTSLNLHGLPMVHRPEDALEVMNKSGLNRLAIGPFLVTKASRFHETPAGCSRSARAHEPSALPRASCRPAIESGIVGVDQG